MTDEIVQYNCIERTPKDFTDRIRQHYKVCENEFCMCGMILRDYELSFSLTTITPNKIKSPNSNNVGGK